ncbi:hypothetical protein Tco_1163944 [Tanacetum coccineum]
MVDSMRRPPNSRKPDDAPITNSRCCRYGRGPCSYQTEISAKLDSSQQQERKRLTQLGNLLVGECPSHRKGDDGHSAAMLLTLDVDYHVSRHPAALQSFSTPAIGPFQLTLFFLLVPILLLAVKKASTLIWTTLRVSCRGCKARKCYRRRTGYERAAVQQLQQAEALAHEEDLRKLFLETACAKELRTIIDTTK